MTQNNEQQALAAQPTKAATIAERTLARIEEFQRSGTIDIPDNYSPANALRAAWLILQETVDRNKQPVLQVCSKESIANALLKMVVLGLNPAKKQCYFIPYGKVLSCDPSYFGDMATARRVHQRIPDDGFSYAVVYQGDDFEFERRRGKVRIIKHGQKLENVNKGNVLAAYCEIYDEDDKLVNSELLTIEEIKQAWKQSKMNAVNDRGEINAGSTHGKFTADMSLKTVIRKACKPIINSSDDKNLKLLTQIIPSRAEIQAAEQIEENAGTQRLGFDDPPSGPVVNAETEPDAAEEVDRSTGEIKIAPGAGDMEEPPY